MASIEDTRVFIALYTVKNKYQGIVLVFFFRTNVIFQILNYKNAWKLLSSQQLFTCFIFYLARKLLKIKIPILYHSSGYSAYTIFLVLLNRYAFLWPSNTKSRPLFVNHKHCLLFKSTAIADIFIPWITSSDRMWSYIILPNSEKNQF